MCGRRQPNSRFALMQLSTAMAATDTPDSRLSATNALELRDVLSAPAWRPYGLLGHDLR